MAPGEEEKVEKQLEKLNHQLCIVCNKWMDEHISKWWVYQTYVFHTDNKEIYFKWTLVYLPVPLSNTHYIIQKNVIFYLCNCTNTKNTST